MIRMKKFRNLAYTGAIALVGMVGFNSCSSDAAEDIQNPNYDAETKSVTTQFVFNVATNAASTQKMTSANTQATSSDVFRGMDNVHILTFALDYNQIAGTGGGSHVYKPAAGALPVATRNYDLSNLLTENELSSAFSRRVIELSLPTGTNTMLFYGKAPKTANAHDAQGQIAFNVQDDPASTTFTSTARLSSTNTTLFNQATDLLATIMTRIAKNGLHQETAGDAEGNAQTRDLSYSIWWNTTENRAYDYPTYTASVTDGGSTTTETFTIDPSETNPFSSASYTLTADNEIYLNWDKDNPASSTHMTASYNASYSYDGDTHEAITTNKGIFVRFTGTKEWSEYGTTYTDPATRASMKPLEEVLGEAYESLKIKTVGTPPNTITEIRAGSGSAVLRLVQDLWTVTDKVKNAEPTSIPEAIAKKMGERISKRFETYFENTGGVVSYKDMATLKANIASYVNGKSSAYTNLPNTAGWLDEFPGNLNLPMGATQMLFDEATRTFSYQTELPTYGMGGGIGGTTTVAKYLYPAELCYWGNSPVRVTEDTHTTTEYPSNVTDWDNETYWTTTTGLKGEKGWTHNSVVKSNSRSVAMQNDINYGTALLETTVSYGSDITDGKLLDNNAAIHEGETDNEITVADNLFELTGVIIGGQPNQVGWNFLPTGTDFTYMLYDKDITAGNVKASGNVTNYTLVWDNYSSTGTQSPVYVALEFKNKAGDFWGNANLVRNGGTFYLIGKLDLSGKTYPTHTQTKAIIPPYAETSAATYAAANGATQEVVRAFIQDYKTTANFKINKASLKSAYVTVPDLRAAQISLGLSVDLKWETGITFDNVVLGAD